MFEKEIGNRLLHSRKNIVAKLVPQHQDNYKWVCIYPLRAKDNYRVFVLELAKYFIDEELDWFEDDEIIKEYEIHSYDDLMTFLYGKDFRPENFDYPWNGNYPYH